MNARYYFNAGMACIENGELKEALTFFEKSTKLQPDFADANFGIGVCKVKLGDKANGEAAIRKAARLGCNEAQLYFATYNNSTIDIDTDSSDIDLPKDERNTNIAVSPSLSQVATYKHLTFSLAARWPRFLARKFDMILEGVLPLFALKTIGSVFGLIYNGSKAITLFGLLYIAFIFTFPVTFLVIDAAIYRLFGNTPGKALLGLKVATFDGKTLRFRQYLARNFSMWVKGLAFCIPVFNLFTMHDQYLRLGEGKQTSYDEVPGFRVHAYPISLMRKIFFGFTLIFLSLLLPLSSTGQQPNKHSTAPIRTSQNYSWENPITQISAKIDSQWQYSIQKEANGLTMHIFSSQNYHVIVYISVEYLPNYTLTNYIAALKKVLVENFQFSDDCNFFNKDVHQFWQCTGVRTDGFNNFFKVKVINIGSAFWRMATIQAIPYESSDRSIDQLQAALWSTVK